MPIHETHHNCTDNIPRTASRSAQVHERPAGHICGVCKEVITSGGGCGCYVPELLREYFDTYPDRKARYDNGVPAYRLIMREIPYMSETALNALIADLDAQLKSKQKENVA